ncbi:uncharacterized protein LOC141910334, partial [Tubulanus polymorphus]|uniref:uncharacterized protein LOC141910334 n=1 Tax=Tubulanus polymorphus TaxID=672921 RepID=UPI003DA257DC
MPRGVLPNRFDLSKHRVNTEDVSEVGNQGSFHYTSDELPSPQPRDGPNYYENIEPNYYESIDDANRHNIDEHPVSHAEPEVCTQRESPVDVTADGAHTNSAYTQDEPESTRRFEPNQGYLNTAYSNSEEGLDYLDAAIAADNSDAAVSDDISEDYSYAADSVPESRTDQGQCVTSVQIERTPSSVRFDDDSDHEPDKTISLRHVVVVPSDLSHQQPATSLDALNDDVIGETTNSDYAYINPAASLDSVVDSDVTPESGEENSPNHESSTSATIATSIPPKTDESSSSKRENLADYETEADGCCGSLKCLIPFAIITFILVLVAYACAIYFSMYGSALFTSEDATSPSPVLSTTSPIIDVYSKTYLIELTLQTEYSTALANSQTIEYQNLSTAVINYFNYAFYNTSLSVLYNSTRVAGFRNGSVIADAITRFNDFVGKSTLENLLRRNDSTLENVTVDNSRSIAIKFPMNIQVCPQLYVYCDGQCIDETRICDNSSICSSLIAECKIRSKVYELVLTLLDTWRPELANSNSPEFKMLSKILTDYVNSLFKNSSLGSDYGTSVIVNFRPGSIVATIQSTFNLNVSLPRIRHVITTRISANNYCVHVNSAHCTGISERITVTATTQKISTAKPITLGSTTASPTTMVPTTASLSTASSTKMVPTTASPTTKPTFASASTMVSTTASPTTMAPTTAGPTTMVSTTASPTTMAPTTAGPTTMVSTTASPTTMASTTASPRTMAPTTASPTTMVPTTASPTTMVSTTASPTTMMPTTASPTTMAPTTASPTTMA